MTVLDERPVTTYRQAPARRRRPTAETRRPGPGRPAVAPMRYRGPGVLVSRATHVRKPAGVAVTVALAGLAALITLWLGSLANLSAAPEPAGRSSDQLAVIRVEAGESLQELASRVAPDEPAGEVVKRIRDLNKLSSAAVNAGQTLIAPVG